MVVLLKQAVGSELLPSGLLATRVEVQRGGQYA